MIIRNETPADYRETEALTREAFWDIYKPGCDEHLLVHKLRNSPAFIASLDLVACEGERIIGNIMYSKARVLEASGTAHEVLCLGPISVFPERQGQGIGSGLMKNSLERARELGFSGVFLMGNPAYYSRFGFKNARAYSVLSADGQSHDYFMGIELAPGRLDGISGRFLEDDVFHLNPAEVEEFDLQFPRREKHVTPTQIFQ